MLPPVNGNDSPTNFRAALAFAVKTTVYSGGALKKERTAARASSAHLTDKEELCRKLINKIAGESLCAHIVTCC